MNEQARLKASQKTPAQVASSPTVEGQPTFSGNAGGEMDFFQSGATAGQAALLQRLAPPQGQAVVRRMSQVQGNQHVQRTVAMLKPGGTSGTQPVDKAKVLLLTELQTVLAQCEKMFKEKKVYNAELFDQLGKKLWLAGKEKVAHEVKPGDCLSTIAQQNLGNANSWSDIHDENKSQIKDPNLIYPGQKLSMPNSGEKDGWLFTVRQEMMSKIVSSVLPAADVELLKKRFEQASRGVMDVAGGFKTGDEVKKFLITGFDPFQGRPSNSSGAAAMALDDEVLTVQAPDGKGGTHTVKAEVQSVVLPVLWSAFDDGIIKNYLGAYVAQRNDINMVLGIGQGRSSFEVEKNASRHRYNETDNDYKKGDPTIEKGLAGSGRPDLRSNTLTDKVKNSMKNAGVTENTAEVKDSGDWDGDGVQDENWGTAEGYLCNEMMYRSLDMVESSGKSIQVGFLHIPSNPALKTSEITAQIREILKKALEGMG